MDIHEFDALIVKEPEHNGAYVKIPFDVKKMFGKERVSVSASFDGESYDGQIVKMGTVGHIIGIRKDIREKISKQPGDIVHVTIKERILTSTNSKAVDAYIKGYSGEMRERLEKMRSTILDCSAEITEKIAWNMPTFVLNGNLVHFSAYKRHVGFYPTPSAIEAFAHRIKEYHHTKGAIQFSNDRPIPYDLVRDIVMFRIKENKAK